MKSILGALFIASCAAAPPPAPVPQASNDAEALFKKMEAAVQGKPLKIKFRSAVEHPATPAVKLEGTLAIDEGNKAEYAVQGQVGTKKFTLKLTSDGTKISVERSETPPPPDLGPLPPPVDVPVPKELGRNLGTALARGGTWLVQDYFDGEYRSAADRHFKGLMGIKTAPPADTDIAAKHTLKNFTLGKAEKVGARNALPVRYDLSAAGESLGIVTSVTLWVDAETSRPVKREGKVHTTMTLPKGGKEETVSTHISTWVETYE
jgi:hypothetical protein